MPPEFSGDGSATFSLFGEGAKVQTALDSVPETIEVDVHEVNGMSDTPEVTAATLTARQRSPSDCFTIAVRHERGVTAVDHI